MAYPIGSTVSMKKGPNRWWRNWQGCTVIKTECNGRHLIIRNPSGDVGLMWESEVAQPAA